MSEKVIATDPAKVENICNLPAPKDNGGIRSILGIGNYYWSVKNKLLTGQRLECSHDTFSS